MSLIAFENQNSIGRVLYELKSNGSAGNHIQPWQKYIITLPAGHYIVEFEFTLGDPFASAAALDNIDFVACSTIPDGDPIDGKNVTGDFFWWAYKPHLLYYCCITYYNGTIALCKYAFRMASDQ